MYFVFLVAEFQNVPESELQSKLEHLNHIMSQDWPQDPTMFYAQCKYFDIVVSIFGNVF